MGTPSLETFRMPLALQRKLTRRARAADVDAADYTRAAIERGLALRDIGHEMQAAITDAVSPLRADIDTLRAVIRELLGGVNSEPRAPAHTTKEKDPERKHRVDDNLDQFFKNWAKDPSTTKKGAKK